MKDLKQITIIGLGLLGGSAALAIKRYFNDIKTVGYTHRASTRRKARELSVADVISGDIKQSVSEAGLVIIATPICVFEKIFKEISSALPSSCIVTDVGSTKVQPHRWAAKQLPKTVHYVGSHPIAGSEKRGVEYARDDLFDQALCIVTRTTKTNTKSATILKKFWSAIGCKVQTLNPSEHDRIFANISHLPHIMAGALINANQQKDMELAGNGFIDTSRIASGPSNIWSDIIYTNTKNCIKGIDRVISELEKIKKAIESGDRNKIEKLFAKAREKRNTMIKYKIKNKEVVS